VATVITKEEIKAMDAATLDEIQAGVSCKSLLCK
jgi:hypothetical protein